ncbi:hypothetical protein [Kitasatospora kazusensis]|uniref:hypothetical protein n=1 Tax=Kitasatospora kazusensis TaxID=407974 RepID=UPI0031E1BFE7
MTEVAAQAGTQLRSLVGWTVTGVWGVWISEEDEWFADLPVVLEIGGERVVVCVNRLEDLSVTWDTIDVTTSPTWWNDWTLQWRSDVHPALRDVVGRTVTGVGFTEYGLGPTDPVGGRGPLAWVLSGLVLGLGDTGLWIYNAGDENGLQAGLPPEDHEYRTTWLSTAPS